MEGESRAIGINGSNSANNQQQNQQDGSDPNSQTQDQTHHDPPNPGNQPDNRRGNLDSAKQPQSQTSNDAPTGQTKDQTNGTDSGNQHKDQTANQQKGQTVRPDPANNKNDQAGTTGGDPHAPRVPADKAKHKPASMLPLFALNHISFLVKDLNKSARFYQKVMGFVLIKRPDVFSFQGSWMFGHGVSVHLLGLDGKGHDNKCGNEGREILEFDNHVSFQCSNLYSMMRMLETSSITYKTFGTNVGGKVVVDRIAFLDPDGNMIEITDAQNLPIVPSASWPPKSMPTPNLEFVSSTRTKEMAHRPKYNGCKCNYEVKEEEEEEKNNIVRQHHLLGMNHVGHIVHSLEKSLKFYRDVLEFVSIELPNDEKLKNIKLAWLFGHGIGMHLMEVEGHGACPKVGRPIDPQDNHISFQCTNMYSIVRRLDEMDIQYVAMDIKEDGAIVNQIFFHDPDGNMIEFCNCQDLPVVPISACPPKKMPTPNLDFSNKVLPCKPRWSSDERNEVEEDECHDLCNKRQRVLDHVGAV